MNRNLLIGLLLIVSTAHAGWESSGGESFRLEKNPWFLKNTTVVRYCVQIDRAGVSASEAEVLRSIETIFEYWKKELRMPSYPRGTTPIATQEFRYQTTCDRDIDLQFKIGYGTLDAEEITFLNDPTTFIGVAIRKTYDEVNLRGRGIVFISSDRGSNPYKNNGQLITEAWSKPSLLTYALLHEVGHVMGIAHTGTGVMAETFLTSLLGTSNWAFYSSRPLISMIQPLDLAEICTPAMTDFFEPQFFGIDVSQQCMRLEKRAGSQNQWIVFTRASRNGPLVEVGNIQLQPDSNQGLSPKPVVFVYLSETQQVFRRDELGFADFLIGAMKESSLNSGIFTKTGSHRPYHLQVNSDSETIIISGVVADQIKPVYSFRLPLLKGVLFP